MLHLLMLIEYKKKKQIKTRTHGKGFSRSNLTYMRKLYQAFPKSETLSHKLIWSHYFGTCRIVKNYKSNLILD